MKVVTDSFQIKSQLISVSLLIFRIPGILCRADIIYFNYTAIFYIFKKPELQVKNKGRMNVS